MVIAGFELLGVQKMLALQLTAQIRKARNIDSGR